ncbi:MAG: DoxX family protein [bacterium]
MNSLLLLTSIKCIIGASIFFVWVIRYENIKKEFEEYAYPDWLRDFVGILKFIFFLFIVAPHMELNILGYLGIAVLMGAAFLTHLKVKNAFHKALPSLSLLSLSISALYLFLVH